MSDNITKYGAIATKVRAMYGKRLTREDFNRISAMQSVTEIANYLSAHPGWAEAVKALPSVNVPRAELEGALRKHYYERYFSILRFMDRKDHPVMRYPVMLAELEEIMQFIRHAVAGRAAEYRVWLPDYFQKYSKIHYELLDHATDYAGLLDAVHDCDFYEALSNLRPAEGSSFPSFTSIEVIIRTYYYRRLLRVIDRSYSGTTRDMLRSSVLAQIDMSNLQVIMRIRRYFPAMLPDILRYLLPFNGKLNPAFLKALYSAPDDDAAVQLIGETRYAKHFVRSQIRYMEESYYRFLYDFNHRALLVGESSVYTPVAYLSLYDIELQNLITLIESVYYHVPNNALPIYIFGA